MYYWAETCKLLERELTAIAMDVWIKKLVPIAIEGNDFIVLADDEYAKVTIEERYIDDVQNTLRGVSETAYVIKIIADEEKSEINEENLINNDAHANLKPKYHFDNFVRGKSNEFAYAACVAVSDAPGQTTYNPLFLYSGVGLGKTHLMHSIGNHIRETRPDAKVLYCSTETFTNELINSIKERKNQQFRNKYRDIDVLLIDDIQFLSEKEGTQEEFFHTFNTLYDANKQIVISSDQPPKDLKILEDRLRSRFGCGLIVDITTPDFETRVAILEKKAEFEGIDVPKDVTSFIAKNVVSNIRELEGALTKVLAFAKLCKTPANIDLAETALKDLISENEKREINIKYVQEVVSNYYNLTFEDMISKKRTQNITYPRQIAMYLSRKLIDISLPKIGEQFGGRDHSTVIHACDKIAFDLEDNSELNNVILELEKKIKGE